MSGCAAWNRAYVCRFSVASCAVSAAAGGRCAAAAASSMARISAYSASSRPASRSSAARFDSTTWMNYSSPTSSTFGSLASSSA
jgi:hypothetical protein